jgi:hypothetical protein
MFLIVDENFENRRKQEKKKLNTNILALVATFFFLKKLLNFQKRHNKEGQKQK